MTKYCLVCGRPFETTSSIKLVCSDVCAKERHRQQKRERYKREREEDRNAAKKEPANTVRICKLCGKEYTLGTKGRATAYCSAACKKAAKRAQRAEWERRHNAAWYEEGPRPADAPPNKLSETLKELSITGQSYAERQKAKSIELFAKVKL